MSSDEDGKWYNIREMWAGLGAFLLVVLWLILTYLNDGRAQQIHLEQIRACGHASDVPACIAKVGK